MEDLKVCGPFHRRFFQHYPPRDRLVTTTPDLSLGHPRRLPNIPHSGWSIALLGCSKSKPTHLGLTLDSPWTHLLLTHLPTSPTGLDVPSCSSSVPPELPFSHPRSAPSFSPQSPPAPHPSLHCPHSSSSLSRSRKKGKSPHGSSLFPCCLSFKK